MIIFWALPDLRVVTTTLRVVAGFFCLSKQRDLLSRCSEQFSVFQGRVGLFASTFVVVLVWIPDENFLCKPHKPAKNSRPAFTLHPCREFYISNPASRLQASSMSALCPNEEKRMKLSPLGPKPLPGVVTMWHLSKIASKTSQLFLAGNFAHT